MCVSSLGILSRLSKRSEEVFGDKRHHCRYSLSLLYREARACYLNISSKDRDDVHWIQTGA